MKYKKRVTLFAGHYGSGKTNLAVNCALALAAADKKTLIADLDIVNPYFRTRDSEDALNGAGVRIIVSPYANSNVDVPALPDEMYSIVDDRSYNCVIDVGGDDRGALALGRLAPALNAENDYEMLFVVNFFRPLTQTAEAALKVLKEVEAAASMRFTGIVNNSNLGLNTSAEDICSTLEKTSELSRISGLPIRATTANASLFPGILSKIPDAEPVVLKYRSDWAIF